MPARDPGSPKSYMCLVLALVWAGTVVIAAHAQTPDCREPQECRELALEARGRGAYETFHDLAWRAMQTGRPNDPDLMYLLARAQALSGRRRDAVVTLRRLAESGFAVDASDEDFRRVRELGEWQYVAALLKNPRTAAAVPGPALVPAPAAVPAVLPSKTIRSAARASAPRLARPSTPPAALAAAAAAAAISPAKPPVVPPDATSVKPAAAAPAPAIVRRTLPL